MPLPHLSRTEQADLAMRYLGKPWFPCATGPDAYDCKGLVAAIYADQFSISINDALDGLSSGICCMDRLIYPEQLAVVLMTSTQGLHVGIWLDADGGGVLHSVCHAGVVYSPARALPSIDIRVNAFYRVILD